MAEEDALYAFERGLRRDIAEKLRIQGVTTVQDAIAMAARVGGLLQSASAAVSSRSAVNQMYIDDSGSADGMEERIARSVLNALQTQNNGAAGLGAKTQTHRGYNEQRAGAGAAAGHGGHRGVRGGRFGYRSGNVMTYTIPGVPAAMVEQRRAASQCLRCGSADHRGMECPNAPSATQPLN